jgi:hypothetical protein
VGGTLAEVEENAEPDEPLYTSVRQFIFDVSFKYFKFSSLTLSPT